MTRPNNQIKPLLERVKTVFAELRSDPNAAKFAKTFTRAEIALLTELRNAVDPNNDSHNKRKVLTAIANGCFVLPDLADETRLPKDVLRKMLEILVNEKAIEIKHKRETGEGTPKDYLILYRIVEK